MPPKAPERSPSACAAGAPDGGGAHFAETLDVSTFQKGNIHTHTTRSDGDHDPRDVYLWYRQRRYNFLAITDHNKVTDTAISPLVEQRNRFVVLTGEEVSLWGAGKQVHVNALCTKTTIGGKQFDTQREALTWAVGEIRAQGGVALVNHPNWDWALTAADLSAAHGAHLLEIWSGHPYVHTLGDETHMAHEAIWENTLDHGERFAGVAVDDAHIYGETAPEDAARPGRGWIFVFSRELTRNALCAALAKGRLYASNGPTLKRIQVTKDVYAIWPQEPGARVEFLGTKGTRLANVLPGIDGAARY
jgi:hypothetical protein